MTTKKDKQTAKLLFKKSLTSSAVDQSKVKSVLKFLQDQKLTHPLSVLRAYKRLVENQLTKEEVVVESATEIKNEKDFEKQLLKKTGAQRVSFKINPEIIIGTKITHGNWIWDETLDAKLGQLTR